MTNRAFADTANVRRGVAAAPISTMSKSGRSSQGTRGTTMQNIEASRTSDNAILKELAQIPASEILDGIDDHVRIERQEELFA